MNLQNIKKMKAEKGFTIVELLIVIVVIGILVAIVIVAYTGVTQQANKSKIKANAISISKVAEARNADDSFGSYPTSSSTFTSSYTKLPNGVTVNATESTRTKASPGAGTQAFTDAAKAGSFEVNYCTSGLIIFYPDVSQAVTATAQTIEVGDTSAGC